MRELIAENYSYIKHSCMCLCGGNIQKAEDLTQDVCLKLLTQKSQYVNIGFEFRTWLDLVIKRRWIRTTFESKIQATEKSTPIEADDEIGVYGKTNYTEKQMDYTEVMDFLNNISQEQGQAVLLKASGYTMDEICIIQNIKKSSVGSRVARARKKLAKHFEQAF